MIRRQCGQAPSSITVSKVPGKKEDWVGHKSVHRCGVINACISSDDYHTRHRSRLQGETRALHVHSDGFRFLYLLSKVNLRLLGCLLRQERPLILHIVNLFCHNNCGLL